MIKIGIIKSKDCEDILNIIKNILFFSVIENIEVCIIDEKINMYDFDIIIIDNKILDLLNMIYLINLSSSTIVLLNIDNNIYIPKFKNKVKIITYGFNTKACITASSVCIGLIQICIQRNIPTLYGEFLEQEEFFLNINETYNIYNILPSIGALIISGLNCENIFLEKIY